MRSSQAQKKRRPTQAIKLLRFTPTAMKMMDLLREVIAKRLSREGRINRALEVVANCIVFNLK